jgi:hypothetical protein
LGYAANPTGTSACSLVRDEAQRTFPASSCLKIVQSSGAGGPNLYLSPLHCVFFKEALIPVK